MKESFSAFKTERYWFRFVHGTKTTTMMTCWCWQRDACLYRRRSQQRQHHFMHLSSVMDVAGVVYVSRTASKSDWRRQRNRWPLKCTPFNQVCLLPRLACRRWNLLCARIIPPSASQCNANRHGFSLGKARFATFHARKNQINERTLARLKVNPLPFPFQIHFEMTRDKAKEEENSRKLQNCCNSVSRRLTLTIK